MQKEFHQLNSQGYYQIRIFHGKTTLNIPKKLFKHGLFYLFSLYYAYIHTSISYANLAWASKLRTTLKKIHSQQKHVIRVIYRKDKFSHTKEGFVQNKVFNLYQLNIFRQYLTDSEKEIKNLSKLLSYENEEIFF